MKSESGSGSEHKLTSRELTPTESTLIGLWESTLHVSPVGVTDHFLAMGGYRFGGIVALETARQLEAQGEEVEILFLLDPKEPGKVSTGDPTENQPAAMTIFPLLFGWLIHNSFFIWLNYQAHHLGQPRNRNPAAAQALPRNRWPEFWGKERRMSKSHIARACAGPVLAFFTERNATYRVWAQVFGTDKNFRTLPAGQTDVFSDSGREAWMSALDTLI